MVDQFDTGMLPLIIGGSVFIVLILFVVLRSRSEARNQADGLRQNARHMEKELQKTNNQLLELRSVVVGLGQKVSEQEDVIKLLTERIIELEHVDGDSRLYSRASKMVQLGAGLDELIEECELPKAEAELMMSLQNKIAGKEKVPPISGQAGTRPKSSNASKMQPQRQYSNKR